MLSHDAITLVIRARASAIAGRVLGRRLTTRREPSVTSHEARSGYRVSLGYSSTKPERESRATSLATVQLVKTIASNKSLQII